MQREEKPPREGKTREGRTREVKQRIEVVKPTKNLREAAARYKHRLKTTFADLTEEDWVEVLTVYGNQCLACGSTEEIEADHIIPLIKGGPLTKINVQPLCRECNAAKKDKYIDYRPDRGKVWEK